MTRIEKEREQIARFCEVTAERYGARGYEITAAILEDMASKIRNNTYQVPAKNNAFGVLVFANVDVD